MARILPRKRQTVLDYLRLFTLSLDMKELFYDWGLEGGGETVYRVKNADGGFVFVANKSVMDIDDNDDEVWHQVESTYKSFEEYWQKNMSNDYWYNTFSIISVHEEIIPFVLAELKKHSDKPDRFNVRKRNIEKLKNFKTS